MPPLFEDEGARAEEDFIVKDFSSHRSEDSKENGTYIFNLINVHTCIKLRNSAIMFYMYM
jgi:hypothetical protein